MYQSREDAGRQLARRLTHLAREDAVVLGLPRGGMVVAAEIARELSAPLDVLVVRKLGAPGREELAIGAITAEGDEPRRVLNHDVIGMLAVGEEYIDQETERQFAEVRRRQALYRGGRAAAPITDRTVIVVDDGIATGATVRAGLAALSQSDLGRLVLAVPVAPPETVRRLEDEVDELVCLHSPVAFHAVGAFYVDFAQTSDREVIALLDELSAQGPSGD